ncbi:MAG: Wzz/FepE/Etk N-terminal domain-containing protein [Polaribacter sp.]|nr:Wzz/FepE/Etk N-terminal domain-containing protein [Polaribacter sp.]
METNHYNQPQHPTAHEDEIDVIALAKTLWNGRKTALKVTLVFMIIGVFVAVFSPKEYTAKTIMVPQTSESKMSGSLGGLAAMAGINLGGSSGEGIPPSLYPQIVQSIPFQKALIKTPLTIEGLDTQITYQEYYKNHQKFNLLTFLKKYTIGLPGVLIKAIKGEGTLPQVTGRTSLVRIFKEEKKLFEALQVQLELDYNDKDGYVKLNFIMPTAISAAQMAQEAQRLLQIAITDFKVQKAASQLEFIAARYHEKATDFREKQTALANFQDSNRGLSTAAAQTRLQQLQANSDLAFSVLTELAKQVETQKIQVKEDTPVFTILEPVSVPVEKSAPKRPLILMVWVFLGIVLGIGFVFGKMFIADLKKKWSAEGTKD